MAKTTEISWTDSTFNPWIGCTKVGPGCDHCYAEALMDTRWHRVHWGSGQARQRTSAANWKQPLLWEKEHYAFALMHGRRRRVFCASLADVFDNEAPPLWRVELLKLIGATEHLDWLLLTKRIGNVKRLLCEAAELAHERGLLATAHWITAWVDGDPPPNVWLGATMVNQDEADRDMHKLLAVPASVRFLSVEPMLGPIRLAEHGLHGGPGQLDWVIVGGESGHGSRPIKREWIDGLQHECETAGASFFYKQWGGSSSTAGGCDLDGAQVKEWPCVA